ncbi:MAG: ABC transporter permease [Oscillospiraceae bacterium]|jgi:ABC-2 type transport system permease protein|nr:ABC transporter permease [Oscillospiraceae bacterium]
MTALYKKDLASYFYSPFAYAVCGLFMLVFSLSFVYGLSGITSLEFKFSFPDVFYNNFYYFIFIIPMLTMKSFAEERKTGTETLLFSSPISISSIVSAKFLAVSTVFGLMIALSLIYPTVTAVVGGVSVSRLICSYIGFICMGLFCISVGLLASSLTDNPIIAAAIGEGAMLILLFADFLSGTSFIRSNNILSFIFFWFSTRRRFDKFTLGVFSLSDVVFYLTGIAVVLIWIIIFMARRRDRRGK